jgi:EAL domain-containing protein (putative c-di-GMP-specific phosphodiesterase class I)
MLVDLGNKVGAKTLAEGIETEEEYATCKELGIDLLQGYYFAHPQEELSAGDAEVARSRQARAVVS